MVNKCREQGFTVIEVVLVVTIISLLTSLVTPALNRTVARFELATSARELGGYIRYVQQRAINGESTNVYLIFNPVNGSYTLRKLMTIEKMVFLPRGISLGLPRENYSVSFAIDGGPSNCAGTITMQNSYGDKYFIKVLVATGKVVISTIP
jgi:prepilin-type N-terminal cleavage/methylation domain-containing protein